MTIQQYLAAGQSQLTEADVPNARLDCLVLLEDCLQLDRAYLLAHDDAELSPENVGTLQAQIDRRAKHEPLAYIRGFSEFYGRRFYVDQHVLEPRPESETMIDLLKEFAPANAVVADIGTGSGALAITACKELADPVVCAVDIDEACLDVAKRNAVLYTASITHLKGDLLEPFLDAHSDFEPTVLLCNLPYVPDDFQINTAATHEPRLAIFGGADGLDLFRKLFAQTNDMAVKPALIFTESLPQQHTDLAVLAGANGYRQRAEQDFIQVFSV